jgi:hypothetical protein
MRIRPRRCRQCRRRFRPKPQTAYKQKTCSRKACQRRRHLQGCRIDHKKRPERDRKRRQKIRAWAMAFQHYWRHYRAAHPAYRERERQRMARKRRRLRNVAKRDEWRNIAVDKLSAIAVQAPPTRRKTRRVRPSGGRTGGFPVLEGRRRKTRGVAGRGRRAA